MSRRLRDILVGLALTLVTSMGVLWQVNEAGALGSKDPHSVPRLVCPLH
ncbi:MAG: hypothetical protein QOD44_1675 [Solirubrobacteraceae bacterium]|jgi:hypothetical protein|nr:hypothetical protein [Solirubrobacteraceae bacterium]